MLASLSSHRCPDALAGSNSRGRRPLVPDAHVHRVVRDIAEQAGEEIHVGHARERVLGELGHVQHGDLAVLGLHFIASRIHGRTGAAFEQLPQRPRVRRQPRELVFLAQAPGRDLLAGAGGDEQSRRAEAGAGGLQEPATADAVINIVCLLKR